MLAIPYSLVVRISGFHPEDPGSIPGVGNLFEFLDFSVSVSSQHHW